MSVLVVAGFIVLGVWVCEVIVFLVTYRAARTRPGRRRTKLRMSGMS